MRIPHQLQDEFPGLAPVVEQLATANREFGLLVTAYNEVNQQVWRIESEREPASDEVLEKLKKRRLLLKDDIALLLEREQHRK